MSCFALTLFLLERLRDVLFDVIEEIAAWTHHLQRKMHRSRTHQTHGIHIEFDLV
jgi:hypothetical protein